MSYCYRLITYMYLANKMRVIDNETILKFAVVYFWKNYTCMKITHFVFFFHANARQNDFVIQWWESLDVYKYQTLHDYNPIINKLMIQMANESSTLMWDVARKDRNVQHECIYWSSVQEKKTIIEWWTQ